MRLYCFRFSSGMFRYIATRTAKLPAMAINEKKLLDIATQSDRSPVIPIR